MSKYDVTTKVYKVDFKKLIDNALNRIYWGKKWVIFNYDKVKIYMELSSINITDNKFLCVFKNKYRYFEHANEDFEHFVKNNFAIDTNEACAILLYKGKKAKENLISYKIISSGHALTLKNYLM